MSTSVHQTLSPHRRPRALSSLAGTLLLLTVATCSPDYKSGVTACAPSEPKCPEGFFCSGIRCYAVGTAGVQPSGAGVDAGTSTTGTGGAPAAGGRDGSAPGSTGGASGSGGRGGSSPPATGGSSPPPAGAAMCGGATATPGNACLECSFRTCCTELQACATAPTCTSVLDCVRACTTPACEMMCVTSNPAGAALLSAVGRCQNNGCATPCSTTTPPMQPPTTPPMPPPGAPGGQAVGKFCNTLTMGGMPTTLSIVVGTVRLSAMTGQCSSPVGTTCGSLPSGRVDLRLENNGAVIESASGVFDLKSGSEYVFMSALSEMSTPVIRAFELTSPERCATATPETVD